jgi:ribosomal protein S18 acetylase RimI-like enzyme
VEVRRATFEDAATLARLGAEVQEPHHRHRPDWFKAPDVSAAVPLYESLILDPAVTAFLAEDGSDGALGYVLVRLLTRPDTPLTWGGTTLEIDQIGVTAARRRSGVGQMLFRSVREFAEEAGASRLHLTVWEFNSDAQAFYASAGMSLAVRRMMDP